MSADFSPQPIPPGNYMTVSGNLFKVFLILLKISLNLFKTFRNLLKTFANLFKTFRDFFKEFRPAGLPCAVLVADGQELLRSKCGFQSANHAGYSLHSTMRLFDVMWAIKKIGGFDG
jgi:hypothetical protein